MISIISLNYIQVKIQEFTWRCKLAMLAFVQAPSLEPIVKLKDGSYIDLSKKKIVLTGDIHIHCEGNLKLSSDKHILIESGRTKEERNGYLHSIWFNAKEDEQGRPLKDEEYD